MGSIGRAVGSMSVMMMLVRGNENGIAQEVFDRYVFRNLAFCGVQRAAGDPTSRRRKRGVCDLEDETRSVGVSSLRLRLTVAERDDYCR